MLFGVCAVYMYVLYICVLYVGECTHTAAHSELTAGTRQMQKKEMIKSMAMKKCAATGGADTRTTDSLDTLLN